MKNEQKIKWALILLVAMNIILVGFIAAPKLGIRIPGTRLGGGMERALNAKIRHFVFRELKLDKIQKEKFERSLEQLFEQTREIKEQRRKLLQEIFLSVFDADCNPDIALGKIGDCDEMLIKLQINHLKEIKNMGSEDQKKKLQEIFLKVVNRPPPPLRHAPGQKAK